jgi:hypothetical protein
MSSRPPPTRKVLSTERPGPTRSPSASSGLQKPLKAKVNLSSLGASTKSPKASPQLNWAPTTQPQRARVQFAPDHAASAPGTPTNGLSRGPTRPSSSQSSVFPSHASGSNLHYGATLSPPVGRAPSPTRPRSPINRNYGAQPSGLSHPGGSNLGRGYTQPPSIDRHDPLPATKEPPASLTRRFQRLAAHHLARADISFRIVLNAERGAAEARSSERLGQEGEWRARGAAPPTTRRRDNSTYDRLAFARNSTRINTTSQLCPIPDSSPSAFFLLPFILDPVLRTPDA